MNTQIKEGAAFLTYRAFKINEEGTYRAELGTVQGATERAAMLETENRWPDVIPSGLGFMLVFLGMDTPEESQ